VLRLNFLNFDDLVRVLVFYKLLAWIFRKS
jgi:hypothetical protein